MANNSLPQKAVKFQGRNEYFITGDTAEMVLYDKTGAEKARTVIDSEDVARCAEYRWFFGPRGYIGRSKYMGAGVHATTVQLHDFILNFKGTYKVQVDHRNNKNRDNRKANLRICTHQQNLANNLRPHGVSGFRGVYPSGKKWRVEIREEEGIKYLGTFGTAIAAARAWNARALELRGEFAVLNDV